jgi:branched-subunit amino acid transport protein
MSHPNIVATVVLMGTATFLIRYLPMALLERFELPPLLKQGLRFVPAATLAGLVLPAMLIQDNQLDLLHPKFFAGLIAAVVGVRYKNVLLTLVVGMVALWVLHWAMGGPL